ncbi:hypothetical protein GFM14_28095 [Rhizobium leguminosarum bv. viciae]|uniref:hypothetical protein n=1 Tax=Rhizobium leguminosarum TaxID=384 RepID=UPI0013AF5979|nr:hypothetical protein [Rhizobium leguminosarum]NKJ95360.1 hypothetical protein [Rhizobium leguminosarum bv. viciae]QIO58098.1 hypothetical protein HA463_10505 [Rhizobium leguminosarum bv. trifolii]
MTSRFVICVTAILRAFPCQQFAVRWRPAPARFIARTIGGPLLYLDPPYWDGRATGVSPWNCRLHSRHDLSPNRIIEITGPVYI